MTLNFLEEKGEEIARTRPACIFSRGSYLENEHIMPTI